MRLIDYQKGAESTFIKSPDRQRDITRVLFGICGESGEVAETIKKHLRGDFGSAEFTERMRGELGDLMWYTAVAASLIGSSLEEVAQLNLDKLQSRKERGVLQGDGSER